MKWQKLNNQKGTTQLHTKKILSYWCFTSATKTDQPTTAMDKHKLGSISIWTLQLYPEYLFRSAWEPHSRFLPAACRIPQSSTSRYWILLRFLLPIFTLNLSSYFQSRISIPSCTVYIVFHHQVHYFLLRLNITGVGKRSLTLVSCPTPRKAVAVSFLPWSLPDEGSE